MTGDLGTICYSQLHWQSDCAKKGVSQGDDDQIDVGRINHHLACLWKGDRDTSGNGRLYLPQPPVGPVRVSHQHARRKDG